MKIEGNKHVSTWQSANEQHHSALTHSLYSLPIFQHSLYLLFTVKNYWKLRYPGHLIFVCIRTYLALSYLIFHVS